MRILLTTPPMQHFNVSGVVFSSFGAYNLAKVAANLGPGHTVKISDYLLLRRRPHTLKEDIEAFRPDMVAIANPFSGYTAAVCEMARLAKHLSPGIITMTGGQAPTYLWERHLQGGFDYVVRFEGEITFRELIDHLARGGDNPSSIQGIAYKDRDGRPRLTAVRPQVEDLDSLPLARRDLAPVRMGVLTPGKAALVEISRGCAFHCSFCSQPNFWGNNRRRHNDAILDEVEMLSRQGYTEICFTDDTVGVDDGDPHTFPHKTAALMEGILQRNIKIGLGFCMRAETAAEHPEFVALSAKAGLALVNMGFESYTRGGLMAVGKGTSSLDINHKAAETLRKHKVLIWGSHIYGAPSQTDEDMEATRTLGPQYSDFFRMTMASPLPGSAAFQRMVREGKVDDDASVKATYYHYTYKDGRDPIKLQREYLRHLAGYYLDPSTLALTMDKNPMKRSLARQSYKGAAFFGIHKVLGALGLSRM